MLVWAKGGQRWGSHIKHSVKYRVSFQEVPAYLQADFTIVPFTAITRSQCGYASNVLQELLCFSMVTQHQACP